MRFSAQTGVEREKRIDWPKRGEETAVELDMFVHKFILRYIEFIDKLGTVNDDGTICVVKEDVNLRESLESFVPGVLNEGPLLTVLPVSSPLDHEHVANKGQRHSDARNPLLLVEVVSVVHAEDIVPNEVGR